MNPDIPVKDGGELWKMLNGERVNTPHALTHVSEIELEAVYSATSDVPFEQYEVTMRIVGVVGTKNQRLRGITSINR